MSQSTDHAAAPAQATEAMPTQAVPATGASTRKRLLIAAAVVLPIIAAGGGGYVMFLRHVDPLSHGRDLKARKDNRGAEVELRRAVREMPDNAEAHFLLGSVQLSLADPVAAEKELQEARNLGYPAAQVVPALAMAYLAQRKLPDLLRDFTGADLPPKAHADVILTRAQAQMALNDLDAAAVSVKQAEALAPDNPTARLDEARILALRHDLPAALARADEALKIDPKMVDALLFKADVLRLMDKRPEALAAMDAAVATAPELPGLRLQRAGMLLAMGDNEKAKADVAAVLKMEPRSALAIYYEALLAVRDKDWKTADTLLGQIPVALPQMPRGEYFLAMVKSNVNELEQATDAGRRYVARNKADPAGYKLLARIDLASGRSQEAVAVLKQGVDAGVGDAEMLDMLGTLYARTGNMPLGLQSLEKAQQLAPDNALVLATLASTRLGTGDPEGAERDLDRSMKLAPERPESAAALVVAALAAGDVAHAQLALDDLRKMSNADPSMVDNMTGLVAMAQLDLEGARKAWQAGVDAKPDSAPLRVNLARVLMLMGKRAEAIAVLKPVLDKEPANPLALATAVNILTADGKHDDAMNLLLAARRAAPDNTALAVGEAELIARGGDPAKALAGLDGLNPKLAAAPAVQNARLQLLLALKRPRDALAVEQQMVAANPQDVEAQRRLAALLLAAGDKAGAVRAARNATATVPGNLELLRTYVGAVNNASGLDAALAAIDQILKDPTNLPGARTLKGGLYLSLRRPADAYAAFDAEYRAAPSAQLALSMALSLQLQGHIADAIDVLNRENARQPEPSIQQALASLQIETHDYAAAEKNLRAVLAARPTDAAALNNIAWVYLKTNNPGARVAAQKAFTLGPSPQAADTLGWVLTLQGDAKNGVLLLQQAAQQLPADPAIRYHLAYALNATGEAARARSVLTGLLAQPAPFDDRDNAEKLLQSLGGPAPAVTPAAAPAAAPAGK